MFSTLSKTEIIIWAILNMLYADGLDFNQSKITPLCRELNFDE